MPFLPFAARPAASLVFSETSRSSAAPFRPAGANAGPLTI